MRSVWSYLDRRARNLEAKLSAFERMEDNLNKLNAGQLVIAVEEEIVKQVFKDTGITRGRGITTISQLEKAIDHERSFDGMFTAEETKRLKTTFENLQCVLSFNSKHLQCIKQLKKLRVTPAHPVFNKEKMEYAVEDLPNSALSNTCMKQKSQDLLRCMRN